MKILFLIPGKISKEYKDLAQKYAKRISFYSDFEMKEIKPAKLKEQLQKLKKQYKIFLLDEHGKEFNSVAFADFIRLHIENSQNICFVLGEDYGFDESLKQEFKDKIALSKLTMQHDLASVVFLEALYRAFAILNNSKYHK